MQRFLGMTTIFLIAATFMCTEPALWCQSKELVLNQTFICLPCGCPNDKDVFTKDGPCPSCGMALVEKGTLSEVGKPQKISEGVYVIRHSPAATGFPQGNTTVIIGDRDVLVVDACHLPTTAREDIQTIKKLTDKPVRYLLNTHWHYDHTWGNSTYASAFPSIGIIAQSITREEMEGFNKEWLVRYPNDILKLKQTLQSGKSDDGKPLKEDALAAMKDDIAAREKVASEFVDFTDFLPNLTFENELDIYLGNRPVQIRHPGKGNTAGDAIAFLPKEKILITGDILVHPSPYLCSGYPSEWGQTLESMAALNPVLIVPGHGEVLHDLTYLHQVVRLLNLAVQEVRQTFYRLGNGAKLEDIQKSLDLSKLRKEFAGDDKEKGAFFDGALPLDGCLIRDAYYEVKLR